MGEAGKPAPSPTDPGAAPPAVLRAVGEAGLAHSAAPAYSSRVGRL